MASGEESYGDGTRRLHPIRSRWEVFKEKLGMAWVWIVDGSVWNLDDPDKPFLEGYRTKKHRHDEQGHLGASIMRRIARCDMGIGSDGLCDCTRFVVETVGRLEAEKAELESLLAASKADQ